MYLRGWQILVIVCALISESKGLGFAALCVMAMQACTISGG